VNTGEMNGEQNKTGGADQKIVSSRWKLTQWIAYITLLTSIFFKIFIVGL
jgi:hypothetical protein